MVHYIGLQKLENQGLLQRLNSFTNSTITNIFREPNTYNLWTQPSLLWIELSCTYKPNYQYYYGLNYIVINTTIDVFANKSIYEPKFRYYRKGTESLPHNLIILISVSSQHQRCRDMRIIKFLFVSKTHFLLPPKYSMWTQPPIYFMNPTTDKFCKPNHRYI